MARLEQIKEEAEAIYKTRFDETCVEIKERLEKQWEVVEDEIVAIVKELMSKADILQAEGRKGKGKYLLISHLYSSYMAGTYEYRMDILDEGMYLDAQEVCTYWKPNFLISYIEKDHEYFRDVMKKKFIRLREYEIREVEWYYQFYYHSLVYEIFRCLRERLELFSQYQLLFGEYMGKVYRI